MQHDQKDNTKEIVPISSSGLRLNLKEIEPVHLSRFLDDKSASLVSKANKRIDDLPDDDINLKICQIPHMVNAVKQQTKEYKLKGNLGKSAINKSASLSLTLLTGKRTVDHFQLERSRSKFDNISQSYSSGINADLLDDSSKTECLNLQTTKDSTADSDLKIQDLDKEDQRQSTLFRKATVKVMTQNRQVKQLNQLAESFLIIGPDKSSVLSSDCNQNLKYIVNYESKQDTSPDPIRQTSQLLSYLIPFGQKKTSEMESPLSVQRISEMLCSQWSTDRKIEFFFIPLISNLMGKNFAEQHPAIFSAERNKFEILLEINPESFYYYYCAKFDDFIIEFLDNESDDWMAKMKVHTFPRYYVVKTVYPFTKLMKSVLSLIILTMAKRRLDLLALYIFTEIPRKEFIRRIDANGFAKEESQIADLLREEFAKIRITDNFLAKIQFNIGDSLVKYAVPSRELAFLSAVEDSFYDVLRLFAFEEFMLVFLSMLSGKSLVFISKSLRKTSAVISSFLAVIKPLQWLYPIVYSLPQDCVDILNAPFPVLIGVNRSSDAFLKEIHPSFIEHRVLAKLKNVQSTHVFVYLDEMALDFEREFLESLYIPSTENVISELKSVYRKNINPLRSDFLRISKPFFSRSGEFRFAKQPELSVPEYIKKYRGVSINRQRKKMLAKTDNCDPVAFLNCFKGFFQNSVITKISSNENNLKEGEKKAMDRFTNQLMKSDSFQFYYAKSIEEVS